MATQAEPSETNGLRRFYLHYPAGHRAYVVIVDSQRRPFDFSDSNFKSASKLATLRDACLYATGRHEERADHAYSYSVEFDLARLLAGSNPETIPAEGSVISVHWLVQVGDEPDVKVDHQRDDCRLPLVAGAFEPIDAVSRDQLDETIAFAQRVKHAEEYREFVLREIDTQSLRRQRLAAAVQAGDVAATVCPRGVDDDCVRGGQQDRWHLSLGLEWSGRQARPGDLGRQSGSSAARKDRAYREHGNRRRRPSRGVAGDSGAHRARRQDLASTGMLVVLLLLLHVVKSGLDPSWHFISEYEIGKHGWIMQAAFLVLALGNVALFVAIGNCIQGLWGRIGSLLFLAGTIGTILGGIFIPDPTNTAPDAVTTSGNLHNLGGALGLAGFLGTLIYSAKLLRSGSWRSARRSVLLATVLGEERGVHRRDQGGHDFFSDGRRDARPEPSVTGTCWSHRARERWRLTC